LSALEDRFVSTFCKGQVIFEQLLNRVNFLSKYARKGQLKYVQLVLVIVVIVMEEVVVVILSVDQYSNMECD